MSTSSIIRVAVTQPEPVWLDLEATVNKTCKLIEEAARGGAKLVTFPECWIPGYPAWIWTRPMDHSLTALLMKNSLKTDSPQMRAIQSSASENKIAVCLGFSENDENSLYIAQATITQTGEITMVRRKIKPTHMERTVFGDGSGDSLSNVRSLEGVGRVGQLACWEHTQPLLKYHTTVQNEDIHVAAWPPLHGYVGNGLWSISREGCCTLSRTHAVESQTFVLHTTSLISPSAIETFNIPAKNMFGVPGGGCSAIFGPDGRQISVDIPETEEGILYADLDFDEVLRAKSFLDVKGHYSRPDLLWLGVDRREKVVVKEANRDEEVE